MGDDDKRWMIRGVDRDIRKAVKEAAKAEGVGVGTWVRRAIVHALDAASDGPASSVDLAKRLHLLTVRLSVLEKSHRALHQQIQLAGRVPNRAANQKRKSWTQIRKSK